MEACTILHMCTREWWFKGQGARVSVTVEQPHSEIHVYVKTTGLDRITAPRTGGYRWFTSPSRRGSSSDTTIALYADAALSQLIASNDNAA